MRSGTPEATMTYRGWSNFETWSVHYWADRDPRLHAAKLEVLDGIGRPVTGADVRRFFEDEMGATTPDLGGSGPEAGPGHAVGFAEIAAAWERDRQFRRGLLGP